MATQQKRPRLSLKIQTSASPVSKASRDVAGLKDATAFNTMSNAYAATQTPAYAEPLTAINTLQAFSIATPVERQDLANRINTPYVSHYPDTPLSAHPTSPRPNEVKFAGVMTATPPLSGTIDSNESKVFTFAPTDTAQRSASQKLHEASETVNTKPRTIVYQPPAQGLGLQPPYTPSQAKHSILRNSPLPLKTAIPPPSPRRQSLRLQQKATRRVGYNSPLEQEITTNKYTKSHIDLLSEDSPLSPFSPTTPSSSLSELTLASPSTEVPTEGRKLSGAGPASPIGVRKRKSRKEKTRRWVWTIGRDDEEDESYDLVTPLRTEKSKDKPRILATEDMTPIGPPIKQIACQEQPIQSIEPSSDSLSDLREVCMTDGSSAASVDMESLRSEERELDYAQTPIAPISQLRGLSTVKRDTPIPELAMESDEAIGAQ